MLPEFTKVKPGPIAAECGPQLLNNGISNNIRIIFFTVSIYTRIFNLKL
jgi:hypothetical protein